MRTRLIYLALLLTLFLICCSDRGNVVSTSIQYSAWRLDSFETGGYTLTVPGNEVYTLHFDNDSLVSGQVHCNTYFTSYHMVPPDSISFGPFNTTKILCPQPSNQAEFRLGFDNANAMKITTNQLQLYYMNRTRVLKFHGVL